FRHHNRSVAQVIAHSHAGCSQKKLTKPLTVATGSQTFLRNEAPTETNCTVDLSPKQLQTEIGFESLRSRKVKEVSKSGRQDARSRW
ncbi:MAG: hypothetical protein RMK89_13090, partial [Armatimonadota bacterium]|nr:hypothetical protein [Armatimonadota bacterium]MDW8144384.1 hypothetical protein [Armatimonadota bacterium]